MQRAPSVLLVVALLVAAACGQQAETPAPTVDEAFETLKTEFSKTESSEDKAKLSEDFLAAYPDSEYSGTIADVLAYYRGEDLGQKDVAYSAVKTAYDQITDVERRFEVNLSLYPLARELGHEMEMTAAVEALAAERSLTFGEHINVVEMAKDAERWEVVENHAAEALGRANVAAYQEDNPDDELTDAELADRVTARTEAALVNEGWAMANLERYAEAQEKLAAAAALSSSNYLGVAKSEVNTYWGRTMLMAGDPDRAIELLGADAVMGDRDEALEALREAFALKNGSDEGFDEYLWSKRLELARELDGFTLADYTGESREISGGSGNVMLLSFWFPT